MKKHIVQMELDQILALIELGIKNGNTDAALALLRDLREHLVKSDDKPGDHRQEETKTGDDDERRN